jgi:RNase P protein component
VAYAVGRSVGSAVRRNRVRRRLRAVVAEAAPRMAAGTYLVAAGERAAEADIGVMREMMGTALRGLRGAGDDVWTERARSKRPERVPGGPVPESSP